MKILFISIGLSNLEKPSCFYSSLLSELSKSGADVTAIAPSISDERGIVKEGNVRVIRVNTNVLRGNNSIFKKGLSIVTLAFKYKKALRQYLKGEQFDYVILPTPPASLVDVALYVKKKMGAKLYVILRDIHPECFKRDIVSSEIKHRVDVYEECKKSYNINTFLYKYMYAKSQKLYKNADWIGCMTPANMTYLSKIAPYVKKEKIVLLPNWYNADTINNYDENALRQKYNLVGKYIAIFGGTIGPAQAVWNIATLAKYFIDYKDIVFLVVGRGPKKQTLIEMVEKDSLYNVRVMDYMPKEDYDAILKLADVGIISIDEKYPVPTSPSKVIGYMAMGKPIIAMFNKGNDYGEFYLDIPNCGLWSTGLDNEKMFHNFKTLYENKELRLDMGAAGYKYYKEHFTSSCVGTLLFNQLKGVKND